MQKEIEKKEVGFTLLEILVVVSIIGVLAGISTFGISKILPKYKLKTEVNKLVSIFRKARQWAISKQKEHGVKFDLINDKYIFFSNSNSNIEVKKSNEGIDIYKGDKISFKPIGTADSGSVKLKDSNGEKYKLSVNGLGRISVKLWNEELNEWVEEVDY